MGLHVRGGQAQASQSTFLRLCRVWLTFDPPQSKRETQSSCSRDYLCLLALSSVQVVNFHHFRHSQHIRPTGMPPSKDNGYFSSWTRRIFLPWRRSSLLNFRQRITLSSPSTHPCHRPDSQSISQSGWLAGCLRDGTFGKTAVRPKVIHLDSGEVLRSHTSDKNTHRQQTNIDISMRACTQTWMQRTGLRAHTHSHSRDSLLTCTCLVDKSSQISVIDRYRVSPTSVCSILCQRRRLMITQYFTAKITAAAPEQTIFVFLWTCVPWSILVVNLPVFICL